MTDLQLLEQHVRTGSEEAFSGVVRGHIDWVYSAALRQVHDRDLAEDVTQAVFIALALQAKSLRLDRPLSPWLLRITRCSSINVLRSEARRRYHEQKAAAMKCESTTELTQGDWEQVAPALDELVARLRKKDQWAVLLRFYEKKSFAEVAQVMGISEEAAKKRVERVVDKLRQMFNRRGLAMTSALILTASLTAQTTRAAPAALLSSTSAASLAAAQGVVVAGEGLMIAKGAIKMMTSAKTKVVAAWMLACLLLGGGIFGLQHVLAEGGSPPAPSRPAAALAAGFAATTQSDATLAAPQLRYLWSEHRCELVTRQENGKASTEWELVSPPWQPSGQLCDSVAERRLLGKYCWLDKDPAPGTKLLSFWFEGKQPSIHDMRLLDTNGTVVASRGDVRGIPQGAIVQVQMPAQDAPDQANLRLWYSQGEWQELAVVAAGDWKSVRGLPDGVTIRNFGNIQGPEMDPQGRPVDRLVLELGTDLPYDDVRHEFRCELKTRTLPASGPVSIGTHRTGRGRPWQQLEYRENTKLEDVAEIRVFARPIQVLTLRDISLSPGHVTQPSTGQ